ncbi:hypothetical protein D3C72_2149490 [compost metagenome]
MRTASSRGNASPPHRHLQPRRPWAFSLSSNMRQVDGVACSTLTCSAAINANTAYGSWATCWPVSTMQAPTISGT